MSHLCPPSGARATIEHELVVRVVERPRAASDPGAGVAAVAPVARPNGVGAHERRRLQRGQENYIIQNLRNSLSNCLVGYQLNSVSF